MNAVTNCNALPACAVNTMLIEWDNELISWFVNGMTRVQSRYVIKRFDVASIDDGSGPQKKGNQ